MSGLLMESGMATPRVTSEVWATWAGLQKKASRVGGGGNHFEQEVTKATKERFGEPGIFGS